MDGEYLLFESVKLKHVGIRRGDGCCHCGPFFTGSSQKYQNLCRQKTSLHRHQICCYANESLFTQAPFCLSFQNILDTQEREKERKESGGYTTHHKVFADLTSSYIRREVVQIKLRLFIIPQAADHQKAFTFNLWHFHSSVFVLTCDFRRETYCMHQNSIALLCNSLFFIVVGQSTEVQMKTCGPELSRKSFQPFESTPQFGKLRLSAKAGPVNVFTGNVPMQLRELT